MKIFILGYESTRKTGKNSVDHFLVSYLVPEMSRLEEPKHDPQNWLVQTTATVEIVISSGLHVDQ